MKRAAHADWPRLLLPQWGCYPLAAEPRLADERVLHVALMPTIPTQFGLTRALRSIATAYAAVDYQARERDGTVETAILDTAQRLRPTLVFMQIQRHGSITPAMVTAMRALCAPQCVIVLWSGDLHYGPSDPLQSWFVELGRVCDAALTVETAFAADYARLGVRRPGFLEVAVDGELYRPVTPTVDVLPIVFLASNHAQATHLWEGQAYANRTRITRLVAETYPRKFACYGNCWPAEIPSRPYLCGEEEAGVYSAAECALSISIVNTITRYTSGRLFRALNSGAVVLVEEFPDWEGLGLEHGRNCLVWRDWESLAPLLRAILAGEIDTALIRTEAVRLGREHTWTARMAELMACVDAIRVARAK